MNGLSEQEILKQASEFAVKGLAGDLISASRNDGKKLSEKQAVAIESALRLALINEQQAAQLTLSAAGFEEGFVTEFLSLISGQLEQAA